MLRLLVTNLVTKKACEAPPAPTSDQAPVQPPDKVAGAPKKKVARSLPKSVCTSLKDLCEL